MTLHFSHVVPTAPSIAFALVLLAGVVGCGDTREQPVPVSGVVAIDGKPLTYGFVRMVPEAGGRTAAGSIDSEGRFTMMTYQTGDGVIRGTHKLQVIAGEPLSETRTKWHAPKKYAEIATSGLTETIDQPTDNLEIKLTWDGGKPFVETQR